MQSFLELTTSRLLLRQFGDSDLENVFRGLSNPEVIKYYGVSYDSLEATHTQMKFYSDLEKTGTGIWWAICSPGNTIFYGAGGLNNLDKEHRKAEIGFWLLPEYWRKGFMLEAMPLICDYGFNKLRLQRIEGFVETENINCIRAIDKLGFVKEGTMKDCEIKNGKNISLEVFVKIDSW